MLQEKLRNTGRASKTISNSPQTTMPEFRGQTYLYAMSNHFSVASESLSKGSRDKD